ncbi:MAG TPA: hypothetical protein VI306_19930 [Pyrinomonadaceae bacterium]
MPDNGPTDNREDVDFRKLLEDVCARRKSYYALFDSPVFKQRLTNICKFSTDNDDDADRMSDDVLIKVSENISDFKPNFDVDQYGGFFGWLRNFTRDATCDNLRRKKFELDDQPPEETLDLAESSISFELASERAERDRRFRSFIENLESEQDRQLFEYALEDLSLKGIESKLLAAGIPFSPDIVEKIRRMLAQFFANEDFELNLLRKPDQASLRLSDPEIRPTEKKSETK